MKIITLKTTLSILLCIFSITNTNAQMNQEDISLDYSYIGSGNTEDANAVSFNKFVAKGTIYNKITKNKFIFFHTASYANININYSDALNIATELEQFHSFSYSIGTSIPMKKSWRFTAVFSPTLASNFEGKVRFNDLQFLGIAFFGKAINQSKSLYLNIGAMYSNTLGSPTPLPYFNLIWYASNKLKYELGFPNTGVSYKVTEKLSLSSKLFIAGDNLSLGNNLVYQNQSTHIDNIRLTNFGWGLEGKMKFSKHIGLKLAGGYTFSRKFEFNDGSNVVHDFKLDNNFYGTVGLSISF